MLVFFLGRCIGSEASCLLCQVSLPGANLRNHESYILFSIHWHCIDISLGYQPEIVVKTTPFLYFSWLWYCYYPQLIIFDCIFHFYFQMRVHWIWALLLSQMLIKSWKSLNVTSQRDTEDEVSGRLSPLLKDFRSEIQSLFDRDIW